MPADDVAVFGGLPLTTPVRTAIDLARHEPAVRAVMGIDLLLQLPDVSRAALGERLRLGGLKGLDAAREVIALSDGTAESPMESVTRVILVYGGLPRPVAQFKAYDDEGRFLARLDLAYPERKIGIEYDGDHHRGRSVFRADARRLNRLRLAGWTILRFTADDVLRHPNRVVEQVQQALRRS